MKEKVEAKIYFSDSDFVKFKITSTYICYIEIDITIIAGFEQFLLYFDTVSQKYWISVRMYGFYSHIMNYKIWARVEIEK